MGLDRLELNSDGVRELLRSPEVVADLERRARAIAGAAGPGHRVARGDTGKRVRFAIITDTPEARLSEARSRSLTRAIDAGRR